MEPGMIPVKVLGVQLERLSGAPVVLLGEQGTGERVLPIFIGAPEARAIVLALEGVERPRPATHDLLADVLRNVEAAVQSVEVTELRAGTFIAELDLRSESGEHRVSCRPSDAIALALRLDTPVYVAREVLDEAGVELQEDDGDEETPLAPEDIERAVAEFQDFLEQAGPEDFEPASGEEDRPEE